MSIHPIFPSEQTAAKLLDMKPTRFRELVASGALPPPCMVHGEERWDLEELKATMRGWKPRPKEEIEL